MLWNAKNGKVDLNGTDMSYVSFGKGSKVLILLPGLSDGLTTVKGKALLLARPYSVFFEKYTVYIFSRRDVLPRSCTIREMAEDQAMAIRILGLDKASVLGVSEGGMIAQYLAIDHPDMVDKLVLAVTAPKAGKLTKECIERWLECVRRGDHKALMIDTAERSYSSGYLRKFRKLYPVIGRIGKPKSYARFLINAEAISGFDSTAELGRISCPTLIIGGGKDKIVGPEGSQQLHEKISGSQLYMYEDLGHAAYEEAPDFNQRVFDFLEGSGAGAAKKAETGKAVALGGSAGALAGSEITPEDDKDIAEIIRANLKVHKLDIPGTAYFDEHLYHLSEFYRSDDSKRYYYILRDKDGKAIGGVGLAEFPYFTGCAELQKLYLDDSVKGSGLGYGLIALIEKKARELGYSKIYLETHTNLEAAIHIYEKSGYKQIAKPDSVVHGTMNRFYLKEL